MNRRAFAATALAAGAVVALSGCRQSVPTDFGTWPVSRAAAHFEPGLWSAKDAKPTCRWTLTNAHYSITGTATAVQLPDAPGVTFASSGCGTWRYVSPGQWTPGDGGQQ